MKREGMLNALADVYRRGNKTTPATDYEHFTAKAVEYLERLEKATTYGQQPRGEVERLAHLAETYAYLARTTLLAARTAADVDTGTD